MRVQQNASSNEKTHCHLFNVEHPHLHVFVHGREIAPSERANLVVLGSQQTAHGRQSALGFDRLAANIVANTIEGVNGVLQDAGIVGIKQSDERRQTAQLLKGKSGFPAIVDKTLETSQSVLLQLLVCGLDELNQHRNSALLRNLRAVFAVRRQILQRTSNLLLNFH
jgi:hypothetical protein